MPESRLPEGCRAAFRFTGELLLGYLRTAAILRPPGSARFLAYLTN